MKSKKIMGLFALLMLIIFATSGVSSADTFGWPVPGYYYLTTTYYYSSGSPHSCRYWYNGKPAGIDIAVPSGTEIFAPQCGTVQSLADLGSSSFGKYFEIKHDDGTITLYAHLSEFNVYNGQRVHVGDLIAKSGNTGNSTGAHLHFEMSNKDTYKYYCDNGCIDPRNLTCEHIEPPIPEKPAINQGLLNLSNSSYAKIFTLTSGRYYNLYSNSELTTRLSSTSWTGENDEIWLTGVGWSSKNVPYARIKYPAGSSRREAYAKLSELFVTGTLNEGIITANKNSYGLYRRLASGYSSSYGIDKGDRCYLLTKQNGWCQVLYPVGSNWRIAWMTESVYSATFSGGVPPVITYVPYGSNYVVGKYYSAQCLADGNVDTWNAYAGTMPSNTQDYYRTSLPPGLSMNSSTGIINGTVSHTSEGKESHMPLRYYAKITAGNSSGTAEKQAYINVWEPPVITTSSTLANGDVNKYYSQTITAEGTEYTMKWKKINGSLPPGLYFEGNSGKRNARIYGYPTQGGEYKFTIQCHNLVGNSDTTTTKEFTIRVGNIASEYKDSRISFTYYFYNGRVGNNYSDYVYIKDSASWLNVNSGEKYIFIVTDGEVPDGLYFEEKNTSLFSSYAAQLYLKGVPKTAKSYQFTVKAKRLSDGGYNTKTFNMNINSSSTTVWRDYNMSILYTLATNRPAGVSYSDYVLTRGGTQPYTASIVGGNLPNGLTLEQDGAITRLKGIPKREGNFSFTLRVMGNHKGYVDKTLYVNIVKNPLYKSGASENGEAVKPKISSTKLPDAAFGNYWEATLEAYGTQPIAWYAVTELPEGFDIDEETGKISGIPMEVKKYKFKVKAENELGSTTKKLKLKVLGEKPVIQTHALPDGVLNASYDVELEFSGTAPIKWKKVGKLPSGLKLNKKEGRIEGTPKKAGTYEFSIKAKNKAGYDVVSYQLVIHETEPTKEEENNNVTETSAALNTVGATPYDKADSKGFNAAYTELFMLSDDEKLEGSILKEDNKPMNFVIDEWVDEYGRKVEVSDVKIFVNDELVEGVEISDEGIFTLSEDIISGEVTVYASAIANNNEIKTSEVNVVTAGNEENQNSESSSGGCSLSLAGFASTILAALAFFNKKKKD